MNEKWLETIRRTIRRLETRSKWRKREERERNIIIKGLKVGDGEIEEKIKKIMGRKEGGGEDRENKKDRGG